MRAYLRIDLEKSSARAVWPEGILGRRPPLSHNLMSLPVINSMSTKNKDVEDTETEDFPGFLAKDERNLSTSHSLPAPKLPFSDNPRLSGNTSESESVGTEVEEGIHKPPPPIGKDNTQTKKR